MNRCPVCGGGKTEFFAQGWDSEYVTDNHKYPYRSCNDCSVIFLENPPLDRLHEIYPVSYYSYQLGLSQSLLEKIKSALDRRVLRQILEVFPRRSLSVLDVGGGSGYMLDNIKTLWGGSVDTHVLDINESAREEVESAGHKFHCTRMEDASFGQKFDVVIMMNFIEHVADPAKVLSMVSSVLSSNGRVLIKTPNTDSLNGRIFRRHNWGGFHCPRHWVLFTRPGLIELGRRCGLAPVWARYTQGGPQWAASILGWMADRGLISIRFEKPMHTHLLFRPVLMAMAIFDFLRVSFMSTDQMIVLLKRAR